MREYTSNASQSSGFSFEGTARTGLRLPAAPPTFVFDAVPHENLPNGFLSVKTVHKQESLEKIWIEMADATRVWTWPSVLEGAANPSGPEAYVKLVVGCWYLNATTNVREVVEIHEMDFCLGDLFVRGRLFGRVLEKEIYALSLLHQKGFTNDDAAAKAMYEKLEKKLTGRFGAIVPTRKMDSSTRRVQCKARLSDLVKIATRYTLHKSNTFCGIELPLPLHGKAERARHNKEEKRQRALNAARMLLASNGFQIEEPLVHSAMPPPAAMNHPVGLIA